MTRLYLTVEGQTEQAFAVKVLQPHLSKFGVWVFKPRLTGLHARKKGRFPTGGLLNTFKHSLGDICRWLKEDQSSEARFSIMVDLYSLPSDFPGFEESKNIANSHERTVYLERMLAEAVNDRRFIPYLQLHEFEAILLSDPTSFLNWFENVEDEVAELAVECSSFGSPEDINCGQTSHPKARIKKYIPDYDENIDGPNLASDIGITVMRERCSHFRQWLETLEGLGEQ